MRRGEGLTGAERMVGPLELFARSKVLALSSDALKVIRVVLEAGRGVRYVLVHRRLSVPMLGLVRLGEPGYDGTCQSAGAEGSEKGLPSKPAVWRTYLLEIKRLAKGKKRRRWKDLRGEVRVGHCRSRESRG